MKKANAKYRIQRNERGMIEFVVWYEAENNGPFFGFFTTFSYDSAYFQADTLCESAGYRLDSFRKGKF